MRSLSRKWLDDSGLPFDWMTLLVGWKGFGQRKLSDEEIIDAAQERVGFGTNRQDKLAALLMHAETRDFWTIQTYLEQLAETESVSETTALQKWRFSELQNWFELASETHRTVWKELQGAEIDEFTDHIYFEFCHDPDEILEAYQKLPDSAAAKARQNGELPMTKTAKEWADQILGRYSLWLASEKSQILSAIQKMRPNGNCNL